MGTEWAGKWASVGRSARGCTTDGQRVSDRASGGRHACAVRAGVGQEREPGGGRASMGKRTAEGAAGGREPAANVQRTGNEVAGKWAKSGQNRGGGRRGMGDGWATDGRRLYGRWATERRVSKGWTTGGRQMDVMSGQGTCCAISGV